jgi:adenylate cyclase
MADLIAQGAKPEDRWRRKLQSGERHVIGRTAGPWSVPWDDRISRRHVEVAYKDGRLHVELLPGARNPIFFRGYRSDQFSLRPGDHFVIGKTTFSLVEEKVDVSLDLPQPSGERTFTVDELRRQPFREAEKRIDVLSRLPEMISGSSNDQELVVRLVNLLLSGIERATAAAVVKAASTGRGIEAPASREGEAPVREGEDPAEPHAIVHVLHWDRRILSTTDFRPSERLIRKVIDTHESVAHVWSASQTKSTADFTLSEGLDWAFCTPVPGDACAGWALYVTGSFSADFANPEHTNAESLRDEVKFAELTATTLNALRESRILATRQASLSQFFSPVVLDALALQEADKVLSPREADVTVLFCDLRGFTQQSERSAGDLFGLLSRVSQALGVMTHHILEAGGVVGDFHGDAAMGFWGWPIAQPDAVERACRAALGIRSAFVRPPEGKASCANPPAGGPEFSPSICDTPPKQPTPDAATEDVMTDFRVGIGIASGRAVAGKIGTVDQVKVTVFGPVVNLAARLETMTKHLRASILIDPPTAAVIRASIPRHVCRVRRLARVRPVGLSTPLEVSELLPPEHDCPALTDEHLASYEAALDAFQSRDWATALKHLHEVPPDDIAKDFLTIFIAQHGRSPPPNWDGSIPLEAK